MDSNNLPNPGSDRTQSAVIKVFGVGGGGCNALEQMIAANIKDVEFKCINTDAQALKRFAPENIIELGAKLTKGLGAGANPEVGTAAAQESLEEIEAAIGDADMLFLTAGMGGGTGTGAIPLIASKAREMGVLTVAVVTEPFAFEGERRRAAAAAGLDALRENADSMIVVPNENLLNYLGPNVSLVEAFAAANDVVTNAVQSIAELITTSGLINVDFADVKTVMSVMGHAIMSTGTGMGEHRAEEAALAAIKSPLLNNVDLKAAKGILANITSSSDLSMGEFQAVGDIIRQIAADDATVVVGTVFDDDMSHEMKVTVVATGLQPPKNETVKRDNDELAAKLTQPTPTASQKAAAEAEAAAEANAMAEANAERERANAQAAALAAQQEAEAHAAQQAAQKAAEQARKEQAGKDSFTFTTTGSDKSPPPIPAQQTQSSLNNQASSNSASNVSVSDVCMICGCVNGRHLEKCPWANGGPSTAQKQQHKEAPAPKAEEKVNPEAVAVETPKSGKKLGFGIAAAGLVALASVAWLYMGGKQDNSLADNEPVTEQKPDYMSGLRSTAPYKIPTLELDPEEKESVANSGDDLIPSKTPKTDTASDTDVTELSDE